VSAVFLSVTAHSCNLCISYVWKADVESGYDVLWWWVCRCHGFAAPNSCESERFLEDLALKVQKDCFPMMTIAVSSSVVNKKNPQKANTAEKEVQNISNIW